MNLKFSGIALVVLSSMSFATLAATIIDNTKVEYDFEVVVNKAAINSIGLTMSADATVSKLTDTALAGKVVIASFDLKDKNVVARLAGTGKDHNGTCTYAVGTNANNKVEICLGTVGDKVESETKVPYYKQNEGKNTIVGGPSNGALNKANVKPDTYSAAIEFSIFNS